MEDKDKFVEDVYKYLNKHITYKMYKLSKWDREDIVQDAVLRAYENYLKNHDFTKACTCAHKFCADVIKQVDIKNHLDGSREDLIKQSYMYPDKHFYDKVLVESLKSDMVSVNYRLVLCAKLYYEDDLSMDSIASKLGVSRQMVKQILEMYKRRARCTTTVRREIEERYK